MRTVGQILKEERERKFYTLDEVETATKIRKELLQALEEGKYQKLPPQTFVQGFIKNYGRFLNLNTENLLAVYRREFSDKKNPPRILESFTNPLDKNRFKITPAKFIIAVVVSLLSFFFIYLWFEYRFLVGAPYLEVIEPPDQFKTDISTITVSGRTDPEAEVSINDQKIAVDSSGKFIQEMKLSDNANTVAITATAKSGQVTKIERSVFIKR